MKKTRSPLKQAFSNLLQLTDRPSKNDETKPSKQLPSILNKTHNQQHRRNTNSIKKVLKELQDLKKDLNDLKRTKKIETIPEQLDNSKCRKLKAETKRSSPSADPHSLSSSKKKTHSHQKETSTQTKRINKREPNDFSFTAHEQANRSPKQFVHSQEQDSCDYNPFSLRTRKQDERAQQGPKEKRDHTHSRGELPKNKISDQIQSIEASQIYEKYLKSLKNSFSMLEISSSAFTGEDRLKLNIELQRLSSQIRRIPMHIRQPVEHYQNVTVYARNLNNQLNNLAVLLNRCEGRVDKLKERNLFENAPMPACKNCEENQKKDWQRYHKREIKRIEKDVGKLHGELQQSKNEVNILTTQNLILMKEKDDFKDRYAALQRKFTDEQKKVRLLHEVKEQMEREIKDIDGKRLKEIQKNKLQEEDMNYYKSELDRFKKNAYSFKEDRNAGEKKDQQSQIITELKEKELLYQSIIRDKEGQISDLKKKISDLFEELNSELAHERLNKSRRRETEKTEAFPDLQKLKGEIEQKNREIASAYREAQVWKLRANKFQARNKELQSILEQCTAEINRLHSEINSLQEMSENYKDKYLKTRTKNQSKSKRQVQVRNRKQSVFHELNALIQNHRSNIENDASTK